jgi:hypothetical protein
MSFILLDGIEKEWQSIRQMAALLIQRKQM